VTGRTLGRELDAPENDSGAMESASTAASVGLYL
jgi:hypothetical protein